LSGSRGRTEQDSFLYIGALGLESAVTFTLTPTPAGTHLHMEQKGFRRDQPQNYQAAKCGWQKFFGQPEKVLARMQ
jgi:uncharacterized protein YndB with AHSA1/START domain